MSAGDQQDPVEALAKVIRPWTLCDDGGGFDHGSQRAAQAVLAAGFVLPGDADATHSAIEDAWALYREDYPDISPIELTPSERQAIASVHWPMRPLSQVVAIVEQIVAARLRDAAARTSTATAEDCGERFRVMARNAPPYICDKPKGHDGGHGTGYAKSTATADTGLRERVAWVLDHPVGYDYGEPFVYCSELRAALNATAAPTTNTGARDE